MRIHKQTIQATTPGNIYFHCPACGNKTLADVDNEVRSLRDIDYHDRFVCDECASEFIGELGYDMKVKFTSIDDVEAATNTCGIGARPCVDTERPVLCRQRTGWEVCDELKEKLTTAVKQFLGEPSDYELSPYELEEFADILAEHPEFETSDDDYLDESYDDLYDEMAAVVVEEVEDGRIRAEVRAELGYSRLTMLMNRLDPIVQQYDREAYFDAEEPGIATAYIRLAAITASKTVGKAITSANYGGAYDIDPEMFFTRDDLVDLGNAVAELVTLDVRDTLGEPAEVASIDADTQNTITVAIRCGDYEVEQAIKVDLRRIRVPADLTAKYAEPLAREITRELNDAVGDVRASRIMGAYDRDAWISPPAYDIPEDLDDVSESIGISFEFDLIFDADGSYDIRSSSDWASGYTVYVDETGDELEIDEDVVEEVIVDDLIPAYFPEDTSNCSYHVSGHAALRMVVTELAAYVEYEGEGVSYELTDDYRIECDVDHSKIIEINFTRLD